MEKGATCLFWRATQHAPLLMVRSESQGEPSHVMEARLIILLLLPSISSHFVSTPPRARRSSDIENGCHKFHAPVYRGLIFHALQRQHIQFAYVVGLSIDFFLKWLYFISINSICCKCTLYVYTVQHNFLLNVRAPVSERL
jgi:hypothetical protein